MSGGGYIGAAIGRLYSGEHPEEKPQEIIANDEGLFLWWLRRHGRFLIPKGMVDTGYAITNYLRGFLAIQWEVGVLLSFFSLLIVLPHVLMGIHSKFYEVGIFFINPWLLFTPIVFILAFYFNIKYWFNRHNKDENTNLKLTKKLLRTLLLLFVLPVLAFFDFTTWLTANFIYNNESWYIYVLCTRQFFISL